MAAFSLRKSTKNQHGYIPLFGAKMEGLADRFHARRVDKTSIELGLNMLFRDLTRLGACAVPLLSDGFGFRVKINAMFRLFYRHERAGMHQDMISQDLYDAPLSRGTTGV